MEQNEAHEKADKQAKIQKQAKLRQSLHAAAVEAAYVLEMRTR